MLSLKVELLHNHLDKELQSLEYLLYYKDLFIFIKSNLLQYNYL